NTILFGNNDSNWMVGRSHDSGGIAHGLLFVPPNRFFTFDYPGSIFTSFNGINRDGFICGRYRDPSGIEHGIIARIRVGTAANEEGAPGMKGYDSRSFVTPANAQLKPSKSAPQTVLSNQ